jgi:putative spermidine/putrescine transport system substrate-binding protein
MARRLPVVFGLVVALCYAGTASARELTVVLQDMLAAAALRDTVIRPFADTSGIPVDMQSWEGGVAALRARLEGRPPWDVVSLTGAELLVACEAGLLQKLDWAALGGRERLLPGGASECGLGFALRALVLAWDRDKLQGNPGWTEFGDVVKFPGRRGLRKQARGTLEVALMADGVPAGEVYRQLRSDAGVDRAFRKLEQLRPYIAWWQDEVEAARLLASGEVLMTSAPSTGIAEAVRQDGRRLALQWNGAVTSVAALSIVAGTPHGADAVRLLSFAADPKVQAALAEQAQLGPLARGAVDLVPPGVQGLLPTGLAALAGGLPSDEAFWRDNHQRLSQRFDAWLPR